MDSCNSSGFDAIPKDLDSSDRLSELPDSLILSILLLLSMIDVVQTTILSKRWKDLWVTIPCLHFIIIRDHHFRYDYFPCDAFAQFINGALAKWRGAKMLKFSLESLGLDNSFDSVIHLWLLFAIEKQVEEFSLDLRVGFSDSLAPWRLYSCSSIKKLSLTFYTLEIEGKVQWHNLKSLTIGLAVSLSEDVMNQVLSGAPQLEELILRFWKVSENLNIRSTSLKTLKIDSYDDCCYNRTAVLGIWAPNLLTLELSGLNCGGYSLVVPSLTSAILSLKDRDWEFMPLEVFNQVFRSISHVEEFTLSEWCSKFLLDLGDGSMDRPLSNAKFLRLYVHEAEDVLDVFDSFPKLMHVIVDQRNTEDLSDFVDRVAEQLGAADYDKACFCSPSVVELKTVEITWSAGDASVLQVMEYLLEKARKLEKMVLRLRMAGANSETFVLAEEKVRSMPRSSPSLQLNITKI